MGSLVCYVCHTENNFLDRLGFRDTCASCHSDLHVCKTCQFYDPNAYNECLEPVAERVKDKERSNFCEFYQPKIWGPVTNVQKSPTREELRAKAEALFSNLNKNNKT
jgi:hypothetical protein